MLPRSSGFKSKPALLAACFMLVSSSSKWRRNIYPKSEYTFNELYVVIFHEIKSFIIIAVTNLKSYNLIQFTFQQFVYLGSSLEFLPTNNTWFLVGVSSRSSSSPHHIYIYTYSINPWRQNSSGRRYFLNEGEAMHNHAKHASTQNIEIIIVTLTKTGKNTCH
jgi:hypothetical protein